MTEEIMNAISSEVYGVWFLIGLDAGRFRDGGGRIYQSEKYW